jgi:hypothetical protein
LMKPVIFFAIRIVLLLEFRIDHLLLYFHL